MSEIKALLRKLWQTVCCMCGFHGSLGRDLDPLPRPPEPTMFIEGWRCKHCGDEWSYP